MIGKNLFFNRSFIWSIVVISVNLALLGSCRQTPDVQTAPGQVWEVASSREGLSMATSDSVLAARFAWASQQALAYSHSGDDPVGLWYEAALPSREAFCMRDVSHQSIGAQYLGLRHHTKNMLRKFAENISESKDWCSFWEINRYNLPAPVDYLNDQEFWYNLPANFDVLIACWNQFLLTGDKDYLDDPVFLNFYQRTMNEFLKAWDLEVTSIMTRNRFMNLDNPLDSSNTFQVCRGLPSYGEEEPLKLFMGGDLICLQYQASQAFEKIQRIKGWQQEADLTKERAEALNQLYNTVWWDSAANGYYSALLTNGEFVRKPSRYILQSGIFQTSDRQKQVLQDLLGLMDVNIESQSYLPRLFYEYDENERAFAEMLDISSPQKERKEYPEVSYAMVEALIEGLMGIRFQAAESSVYTLPHLADTMQWVRFNNIPWSDGTIMVMHNGNHATTLKNNLGRGISWTAGFPGTVDSLLVGPQWMKAQRGFTPAGNEISRVEISLQAGDSITIMATSK